MIPAHRRAADLTPLLLALQWHLCGPCTPVPSRKYPQAARLHWDLASVRLTPWSGPLACWLLLRRPCRVSEGFPALTPVRHTGPAPHSLGLSDACSQRGWNCMCLARTLQKWVLSCHIRPGDRGVIPSQVLLYSAAGIGTACPVSPQEGCCFLTLPIGSPSRNPVTPVDGELASPS